MARRITSSTADKFLSVFWYIDGSFFGPESSVPDRRVVAYGPYLQLPDDHSDVWPRYKTLLGVDTEYTYYPRGRVMFRADIHKFWVVADKKISNDLKVRQKLLEWYGLPSTTIFTTDEHYQSEA